MEKDISKIKDKLELVLGEEKGILFGYLFGSMASGKTNLESDIDLAFYLEEKEVKNFFKKRLFLIEKIQSLLKKRVEVIILNEVRSIFFKFVIIKEGKIILERDHAQRIDFELKTMQEYYDFRPFAYSGVSGRQFRRHPDIKPVTYGHLIDSIFINIILNQ